MYYTHKKSGVVYKFGIGALLQNKEGEWVDCVVYENEEGMVFVRQKLDWEKSFIKNSMKDRKTQRAVKNVLHNELGITKDKVDSLMNDYIDKKFDSKMEILMNTLYFDRKVADIIKKQMLPMVRDVLEGQLEDIKIDVSLASKVADKPTSIYLITNETDKTVEDTLYEFLDAKVECEKLQKKHPEKSFMVVESKIK